MGRKMSSRGTGTSGFSPPRSRFGGWHKRVLYFLLLLRYFSVSCLPILRILVRTDCASVRYMWTSNSIMYYIPVVFFLRFCTVVRNLPALLLRGVLLVGGVASL